MNLVVLMGRLTRDPEDKGKVTLYTLAVDGRGETQFIQCKTFGKNAEFANKYLHKGMKILVKGSINTGSYEKDGRTIHTTDVIVNDHYFCESKRTEDMLRDEFTPFR